MFPISTVNRSVAVLHDMWADLMLCPGAQMYDQDETRVRSATDCYAQPFPQTS